MAETRDARASANSKDEDSGGKAKYGKLSRASHVFFLSRLINRDYLLIICIKKRLCV